MYNIYEVLCMNDQIIVEEQNKKIGFIEYIKKKLKLIKYLQMLFDHAHQGKLEKVFIPEVIK